MLIFFLVVWFIGYLYFGIRYWDAWNVGYFLTTIFGAIFWPIYYPWRLWIAPLQGYSKLYPPIV